MKQLEITTNKRLLIVEYADEREAEIDFQTHQAFPESDKKALCKGIELAEDVISQYVENFLEKMDNPAVYRKYDATEKDFEEDHWSHCADDAVHSFISAINASGYYWGENPVKRPIKDDSECAKWQIKAFEKKQKEWQESESRTFTPEKCIIFEIL